MNEQLSQGKGLSRISIWPQDSMQSGPEVKTINGELARAISKFNAHLLIFLCNNPEGSVAISRSCSRTVSESSLIVLGKHPRPDTIFWGLKPFNDLRLDGLERFERAGF